jgi:hypothetical protein
MNKLTLGITAGVVYEAFTVAAIDACPLPRDQVCVTSPRDCSEDLHIERDMSVNSSTSPVGIVQMIGGATITPGTGALTFNTPQHYVDIPQPYYKRAASLYHTT